VDEGVAHPDQTGDERTGQIRVRNERPRDGESNLPAVRMTGDDEAVIARDGLGRRVGRVHHGDAEPLGRPARREAKIVTPDVCIVQTEELDAEAVEIHLVVDVRQVSPPVGFKTRDEVAGAGRGREEGKGGQERSALPATRYRNGFTNRGSK
jgi:hypothetical protein